MVESLIPLREKVMPVILRYDARAVLNGGDAPGENLSAGEMIAVLAATMQTFFRIAAREEGARFDYQALEASDALAEYRRGVRSTLRSFDLRQVQSHSRQLAFWINLYNLLVIDAVITYGIKESVTEGWAGVLRFFRLAAYEVGGSRYSLDEIEQGLLRSNKGHPYLPGGQFRADDSRREYVVVPFEPLIHFGLNCASRSCPRLRPFSAEGIQDELALAAQEFLAQTADVDVTNRELLLSMIFKWFGADFGGDAGILSFVRDRLADGELRDRLNALGDDVNIRYRAYDWGLNRAEITPDSSLPLPRPSADPTPRR